MHDAVGALTDAGIVTSASSSTPDLRQVEAAARIGAQVCEIHTRSVRARVPRKGRDPESAAVVDELAKIRDAGEAVRDARHALQRRATRSTISTCSRSRRCPACASSTSGTRSSRARCSSGLREAVRQMKALIARGGGVMAELPAAP